MVKVKRNRNGYGSYVFEKGKSYCMKQKCLYSETEFADKDDVKNWEDRGFKVDRQGNVWLPKNTPMKYIGDNICGWPTFLINGEDYDFSSLEDYVVYENI